MSKQWKMNVPRNAPMQIGGIQLNIGHVQNMYTQGAERFQRPQEQMPISGPTGPLLKRHHIAISKKLSHKDCDSLGAKLGVNGAEMRSQYKDADETAYRIILKWQRRENDKATAAVLAKYLNEIRRSDLLNIFEA